MRQISPHNLRSVKVFQVRLFLIDMLFFLGHADLIHMHMFKTYLFDLFALTSSIRRQK